MMTGDPYLDFLRAKVAVAPSYGLSCDESEISPVLKPHQRAAVRWAVEGGRRAIFAAFGLGKSVMQLEVVRLCQQKAGGRGLIILPLGVRQEFLRDAAMLGTPVQFIRRTEEAENPEGIYLTNYESVREGKLDFGHTDDNAHFWQQMGFLIPELLRVLQPGLLPGHGRVLRRRRAGGLHAHVVRSAGCPGGGMTHSRRRAPSVLLDWRRTNPGYRYSPPRIRRIRLDPCDPDSPRIEVVELDGGACSELASFHERFPSGKRGG